MPENVAQGQVKSKQMNTHTHTHTHTYTHIHTHTHTHTVNSEDLLYLCTDSSDCCWGENGKWKPHACFAALLSFTPSVTAPSLFPSFSLPPLPLFLPPPPPPPPPLPPFPSLVLYSLRSFSSLSLLSHLAEPYCIQIRQAPYKAAQLNMSHIIYPQQAVSSPFTARAWIERERGRRGDERRGTVGVDLTQTNFYCQQPRSHNFTLPDSVCVYVCVCVCVHARAYVLCARAYVNKCLQSDRENATGEPPKNAIHLHCSNTFLSPLFLFSTLSQSLSTICICRL